MIPLVAALLLPPGVAGEPASPPPPPPAVSALDVACARAVTFSEPYPWSYGDPPTRILAGTALVVEAEPALLRPRQVGQRVLYADGAPVEILARAEDRALVLVPRPVDPEGVRVWFGGETLPERVTVDVAARELDAAAGLARLPVPRWGGTLVVGGRNALLAAWAGWATDCGG